MSERRICKYCGMELSEDVPHGLRQCHLHAVARIAELEAKKDILENQLREATNFLIDKKLHVDSLYEDGFKLQKRIDELESAQRWIPVSERLPECEKDVLVFWGKASDGSKVDWFGTAWRNDSDDGKWCTDPIVPTHWMPLPQPPEVQE